jgi:outer membrane protein assembly factor BamB
MELDDDGPSMAVPYEDLILFGTESCTLFALHQDTGKLAWSAYLGDPLLSGPAIANGKVVTVYPAVVEPPAAVKSLIEKPADPAITVDTSATEQSRSLKDELAQISAAPRQDNQDAATKTQISDLLEPTHVAICMHARTGEVLWQRWIDSDCLSNPVIAKKHVYITSLSGTLYEFSLDDGSVLNAQRAQGTSAPLIEEDQIYLSRRLELPDGSVLEYLATLESDGVRHRYATDPYDAPYLQASVQMNGELQDNAMEFEQMNGFGGGGFGGGFGGGGGGGGGTGGGFGGGGGMFQIPDPLRPDQTDSPVEPTEQDTDQNLLGFELPGSESQLPDASVDLNDQEEEQGPESEPNSALDYSVIGDLLGYTEIQAAENIGLGSASTIQGFAGSVPVADAANLYLTMGDRVACYSRDLKKEVWALKIDGDLRELGGRLASPPVLFDGSLYVATADGKVLNLDRLTGKITATYPVDAPLRFRPCVTSEYIVVTTQDGRLFCLRR